MPDWPCALARRPGQSREPILEGTTPRALAHRHPGCVSLTAHTSTAFHVTRRAPARACCTPQPPARPPRELPRPRARAPRPHAPRPPSPSRSAHPSQQVARLGLSKQAAPRGWRGSRTLPSRDRPRPRAGAGEPRTRGRRGRIVRGAALPLRAALSSRALLVRLIVVEEQPRARRLPQQRSAAREAAAARRRV